MRVARILLRKQGQTSAATVTATATGFSLDGFNTLMKDSVLKFKKDLAAVSVGRATP